MPRGNTSTMWKDPQKKVGQATQVGGGGGRASSQPTLFDVLHKKDEFFKKGSPRRFACDDPPAAMFAQDLQPFSLVSLNGPFLPFADKGSMKCSCTLEPKYEVHGVPWKMFFGQKSFTRFKTRTCHTHSL